MEAQVEWKNGMAFEAHLDGYNFTIDSDEKFGGQNLGPKPKGLTMVSLAGCTGMDVISILGKMRIQPESFKVATEAVLEENLPRRFLEVVIKYILEGKDLPTQKIKQAIDLSLENYCGVSATLKPSVKISHKVIINGEEMTA